MSVSGIADVASTLAQVGTSQDVNIAVLKKSNELQTEDAAALISAIPNNSASSGTSSGNLPPHLGQNVNVVA